MDGEGMQVGLTQTSLVGQKEMRIDILKRELKSSNKALINSAGLDWQRSKDKEYMFVLK